MQPGNVNGVPEARQVPLANSVVDILAQCLLLFWRKVGDVQLARGRLVAVVDRLELGSGFGLPLLLRNEDAGKDPDFPNLGLVLIRVAFGS